MTDTVSAPPDRSRPPLPGPTKDVVFPAFFATTLGNGLKILVYERHEIPIAHVTFVARAGSQHDAALPGLASMTAELLTKGTPTRNAERIVEEVESLGGSIGAGAGWDSTSLGVTVLSAYLPEAMETGADVLRNASFPEEELERARAQRMAQLVQRKSQPAALAGLRFARALYGGHPYGSSSEGIESSIAAMTRDAIAAFHARAVAPDALFVVAVGDVDPAAFAARMERLLGDWPARNGAFHDIAAPDAAPSRLVHVVDRPSSVQSSILVGHEGIPRRDPAYITVSLLNTLFGGYFGSRLNLNLREDKGFTYGAHSRVDARMHAGPFAAGVEVRTEVTADAVAEILAEFARLRDERVGDAELAGVQQYVTGNFPIQIETPTQVAQRIVTMELYGLGYDYYNTFNSRVLAVTPDDLLAEARRVVHPERLVVAVSGRADALREPLARFGAVEVWSPDDVRLDTP